MAGKPDACAACRAVRMAFSTNVSPVSSTLTDVNCDCGRTSKAGGGNSASEAAVAAGLAWLARKQLKDGSWEFDGGSKDKIAATGMALLPFLAAGETHKYGKKYKKTVENGLTCDQPFV